MNTEDVMAQIDPLLAVVEPRITRSDMGRGEFFSSTEAEARAMRTRITAAIERLTAPGSVYREQVREISARHEADEHKVVWLAGVLRGLRDDNEAGYLLTVAELIHADVFADFLEMASELHAKHYQDAAAVIAGSVLEEHLRKLAIKHGIDAEKADGAPKKADTLNADLARETVYRKLVQKSVTAWLGLRNSAAHGKYGDYNDGQVAALIREMRDFMIRHPA